MMEMETESTPKAILQISQNPVIKLIFLALLLFSCGIAQKQETMQNRTYNIINAHLDQLTSSSISIKILLDEILSNQMLKYAKDMIYDTASENSQYLSSSHNVDIELIKEVFHIHEVEHYEKFNISETKLDISKIDPEEKYRLIKTNDTRNPDLFSHRLISLSKPVFTQNGNFAMIAFYDGNYLRDTGQTGFSIYKQVEGEWKLIETIIMEIN